MVRTTLKIVVQREQSSVVPLSTIGVFTRFRSSGETKLHLQLSKLCSFLWLWERSWKTSPIAIKCTSVECATVSETIAEKEIAEINRMQIIYSHQKWNIRDYTYMHVAYIANFANAVQVSLWLSVTKGRMVLPNRRNFQKNSKRPLNPPPLPLLIRKILLQILFSENVWKSPI